MNNLIDGTITDFDEGDLVNGTVVKIEHDEVLVDIGFKSEGVIPVRELSIRKDANPADIVALGDPIEALVLQKEDKDGRLVLSKKRAEYERAWNRIEEKFNSGENVEGEVIEVVKGGLILDIGLRGFLPASLVDLRRVKDLTSYMGTRIDAAFLFVAVFVGYAVGSAPIVSYHYGARNHAELNNLYSKSLRLIGVIAVVMTALSMLVIPYVARIFVGYDAELLALTSHAFRVYALNFFLMGFNVYGSSFFTALGDGVTSALISFLRTLLFQLLALIFLPMVLGIEGVWLAVTAAELAALVVMTSNCRN
mgnify:CR=1 FL=1